MIGCGCEGPIWLDPDEVNDSDCRFDEAVSLLRKFANADSYDESHYKMAEAFLKKIEEAK